MTQVQQAPGSPQDWMAQLDAHPFHSLQLTSAGCRLALRKRPAQGKARRSLLCLHGFLAHAGWWDAMASLLPPDWEVISLSFAGMGDSDWRQDYDRAQDWRDVVHVAEQAGFANKPIVLAHSFGGAVAIHAMRQAPHAFERLLVCDTSLRFAPAPSGRAWMPQRRYFDDPAQLLARFRLIPEQPVVRRRLVERIARQSMRHYPQGWSWSFDFARISAPERNRDFWNDLIHHYAALDPLPVFIRGSLSALCSPLWLGQYHQRLGADAPVVSLEGAYHHVLLDQPEALADTVVGLCD